MRSDVYTDGPGESRLFGLTVILGTAGMLAAAATVGAVIGSVHHAAMGAGHFEVAGVGLSYPKLNGAEWLLIALAAVGATAITRRGAGRLAPTIRLSWTSSTGSRSSVGLTVTPA